MADTYTTASKARLIQDATRSGTWGPVINSDALELIDDAAIGYEAINIGASTTYSMAAIGNGSDSETRAAYWKFSGTPAGAVTITVPASLVAKVKRVDNSTGQKLTIGYSTGSTVVLASGYSTLIWFDGTDAFEARTTGRAQIDASGGPRTCILSDAGKHIYCNGSTTGTVTIPANSSVPYKIGTEIVFFNFSAASSVSIAITTDTMYLAGTTTTGTRTLAVKGYALAMKTDATAWVISGNGVT